MTRYTWLFIIPPIAVAIIVFVAWYRYHMHSQDRDLKRVAVISHTKTIKLLPAYRKAVMHYRILIACAAVSFIVALVSLTAAAARPISDQKKTSTTENRDVVLCMDVSGSMRPYQEDLLSYFNEVVGGLAGQRIAVTIFDGKPANLIPLTDDYDALIETISNLSENYDTINSSSSYYSPISATYGTSTSAIGDGVMGCVNTLDLSEKNQRAKSVIIATDNSYGPGSQSVDIGQVARYAERYGVTFYGIFIPDVSTQAQQNEFMNATKITNGTFYNLKDYYDVKYDYGSQKRVAVAKNADKTTLSIIKKIMAQETAKMEGAPEIIYTDQPNIALYIAVISFAVFAIIIWRLRL